MIEPKDLRAGNEVFFTKANCKITLIKVYNESVMFQSFPTNSSCPVNDISGIPVTPALFSKLSFEYDSDKSTWSGQGVVLKKNADGYFYGARIERNRARIIYLHELQNYITDYFNLFHHEKRMLTI